MAKDGGYRRLPTGHLSLLVLAVGVAMASEARIELRCLTPIAIGESLLHLRVTAGTASVAGPHILQLVARQDQRVLADLRLHLDNWAQLQHGVDAYLNLADNPEPLTVQCQAVLHSAARNKPLTASCQVTSRMQLVSELAELGRSLPAAAPARVRLWLEQGLAAVRQRRDPLAAAHLQTAIARLRRWLGGEQDDWPPAPGTSGLGAYRCSIDGSIQPFRWHRGEAHATETIVLLHSKRRPPRKDAWPTIPSTWVQAAQATGCQLIEWYPAGDHHWQGIAPRRLHRDLQLVLTDCGLQPARVALVGVGAAAHAALLAATRQPEVFPCVLLVDGSVPEALPVHATDKADRAWLLEQRSPTARPAQCQRLAIASCDGLVAGLRHRLRAAGVADWQRLDSGLAAEATWLWLRNQLQLPAGSEDRRWTVPAPGRYGPMQVSGLSDWPTPGRLLLLQEHNRPRLASAGCRGVAWLEDPPAAIAIDTDRPLPLAKTAPATGIASAYANGPFAIVVGSGESVHAQRRNQATLNAFLQAWVAHAQGLPRVVTDRDTEPDSGTLICIGNPLTNARLAARWRKLEKPAISWTHRDLRGPDDRRRLRASGAGAVYALPDPLQPTRLLVVIDGALPSADGGLPLVGCPHVFVHGGGDDLPPAGRLLTSYWR